MVRSKQPQQKSITFSSVPRKMDALGIEPRTFRSTRMRSERYTPKPSAREGHHGSRYSHEAKCGYFGLLQLPGKPIGVTRTLDCWILDFGFLYNSYIVITNITWSENYCIGQM